MKEIVDFLGSKFEVLERYELSDEYMKETGLFYKNRIKLRHIEDGFIIDCANTTNI